MHTPEDERVYKTLLRLIRSGNLGLSEDKMCNLYKVLNGLLDDKKRTTAFVQEKKDV